MYFWLGVKNLSRNKKRTFFTVCGIVLSVMLMSTAYCAVVGIARNAYDPARKIYGGDLVILSKDVTYQKMEEGWGYSFSSISSIISESDVRSRVSSDNVQFMYPVILRECIFFYEDNSFKNIILGVDFETQEQAIHFSEILTDGRFFEDMEKDRYAVLLNREAWGQFYPVGSTVSLLIPSYEVEEGKAVSNFDMGDLHTFETIGLFTLGGRNVSTIPHVPIQTLRNSVNSDIATYMAVTVRNFAQLDKTRAELKEQLPEYTVLSVNDLLNVISEDFNRLKIFIAQIIFIMYVVSGLIVFNTMLVSVEERKREVAVLRALGVRSSQVMLLFLVEACLYGLLGTSIGVLLGALLSSGGGFFLNGELLGYTFGLVLVVAVGAGIYPALNAVKQSPMEGLRYG
jgi:ABC-type lipoprotein release transport system permease subunit